MFEARPNCGVTRRARAGAARRLLWGLFFLGSGTSAGVRARRAAVVSLGRACPFISLGSGAARGRNVIIYHSEIYYR